MACKDLTFCLSRFQTRFFLTYLIAMKTRIFGQTGRPVSEIGLGTWQIGAGWGEVTEADALATLRAAVDAGVTFLDTADVYGDGRSERLIGQFRKETKVPLF